MASEQKQIGSLGIADTLFGGLAKGAGDIAAGYSSAAAFKYQSAIATLNAQLARQNGERH